MNTTNVLVTTNGTIITVTTMHAHHGRYWLVWLAAAGIICLSLGLYLLLRGEKR
ncbi:MAG TPA: hypothetical protein VH413_04495 [Verrucomicrobiae bacterium]|nr:hypothetical protein [Verrucomicrobiae bacterium]